MMKIKNLTGLVLLLLFATPLFSQFTLDGEFRPRVIADNGYKTIKLKSDPMLVYISQRSRINLGYKNDKLETCFSLQDVHYWGDDDLYSSSGVSGNSKGINLYQAWIAFRPAKELMVKIGRQPLSYDDQRLIAVTSWGDYQLTYDAVLFTWAKNKGKLDLAASWNSSGSTDAFYPKGKLKMVDLARYEQGVGNFILSGIMIVSGNTKADTISSVGLLGSYGLNVLYKVNGFDARITGYYQNSLNDVTGDLNAYCVSVYARKSFLNDKASVGLGADIYSGNDGTNSDAGYKKVQHKFNSLYGNRHSILGYLDYYTSIPEQGILDYMVKTEYKFSHAVLLQADYHLFRQNNASYDLKETSKVADKALGSELDFTLQWKVMKDVVLQGGYSFYNTSDTFEKIKKVYGKDYRFPQFAYVMITVKPTFFKGEGK